jgi:hypothetical protein
MIEVYWVEDDEPIYENPVTMKPRRGVWCCPQRVPAFGTAVWFDHQGRLCETTPQASYGNGAVAVEFDNGENVYCYDIDLDTCTGKVGLASGPDFGSAG